ncbi:hypothetical protein GQ44DRAFT_470413 [Phaeosphaeriaceae sp. PMI808]|nr:hypothetical protein GQ44DRAFT_470413 [Phaeosphaeriaceae sp. PMI808]
MPPTILERFDIDTNKKTCALWLASQEAIMSITRKSNTVDIQAVQARLSNLANSIIRCKGEDRPYWIDRGVHYHSTRILLSLVALFAPSFAEASWLALHYGHHQWHDGDQYKEEERNRGTAIPKLKEWIREDLMESGYYDLPRQDDPRTLSSIFIQPFPVTESSEVIELLRRTSATSTGNVGRAGHGHVLDG